MQIPAQPSNMPDAAALRRDVAPTLPVAAVAGVAEQAQKLDPRVALRWAQPVFDTQAGRLHADPATAQLAPTGAAAYPQLSALASLLGPWLAQAQAQWIKGTAPRWPEPASSDADPPAPGASPRAAVQQAMQGLMMALARSDAFAASQLVQAWWGKAASDAPASASQQARWMAALAPGSEGVMQAARLLLTGQLVWEGALLPDLPVEIRRQDAWRGDASSAQGLEKGAALQLSVDLPGLGILRIAGQQWGDAVQLQVQLPADQAERLRTRWADLQSRLQSYGTRSIDLRELPAVRPETTNRDKAPDGV